ncbi:glutathione S-transferase [Sphingomonas aliaeris]|uniref:Glutathione S-transferase n=1 Tax=Sphingomonas aliaeris TaxID=2759526 RepID=A0A974NXW5_9SPHN|nr:glutathione S-transferase [Sphingomonas aliaeris]QQV79069.1 glutathione S-transferase [Sphingomonas aliaeris]
MPILYSFRRCPYAMRARLAVRISGLAVDRVEVKLRDKPPAMLAASPKGTVPVLVLPNGRVIDESLDIMRHALAQADPEDWLAREDAAVIAANDGAFKHHLDRYKYPDRHDGDPIQHRAAGLEWLRTLDYRLAGRANLGGEARGLTDMAVMPFVRQFAAVDRNWFDAQDIPRLKRWLETHMASALFVAIMERTPEMQAA